MIRIGIIGSNFGQIGLLPAFENIKGCKVVGTSKGHDWKKFLGNKNMDAVALAVSPNAQYIIAKAAIKNGLHVFAEKPLSATSEQAKELYSLAKKKRVTTAVDFIFPEIAEWVKVKELLDNKTYGNLKHISVRWDWLSGDIKYKKLSWKTKLKEGGGVLSFYFSHGLYYLENFAGKITDIKSLFTNSKESLGGSEVGIDLLIKFKNKVTANVHVSSNTKGIIKHQLIFICEKGTIILENENAVVDGFTIKVYSDSGVKILKIKKDKGEKSEDERVKIIRTLATKFIRACKTGKQMRPSFIDGLRVQKLITMARTSSPLAK